MATIWICYNFQVKKRIDSVETIWGDPVYGLDMSAERIVLLKSKVHPQEMKENLSWKSKREIKQSWNMYYE